MLIYTMKSVGILAIKIALYIDYIRYIIELYSGNNIEIPIFSIILLFALEMYDSTSDYIEGFSLDIKFPEESTVGEIRSLAKNITLNMNNIISSSMMLSMCDILIAHSIHIVVLGVLYREQSKALLSIVLLIVLIITKSIISGLDDSYYVIDNNNTTGGK